MRRDVNPLNLIRDNFVIIVCTVGLFSYTVLFQLSTPPHSRSEMDSEIGKAHEIDSLEGVLTDGGGENVPDEQPTLEYGPAGSPITPADDTAKNPSGFPVEEEDHIAGAYDEEEGEQKEEDEEEQEPEAMIEVPHNPLSGEVDVKALLDSPLSTRIIVSTKLKAMYCPIPKVACSNWKALFRRLEGHNDYKNLALAHDRERSGLKYLKDFSEEELKEMMADESFIKFVFVRNPYTRILSAYLDKFQRREINSDEFLSFFDQLVGYRYRMGGNAPYKPTFEEFVGFISKQEVLSMNEHWRMQTQLCQIELFPYDFVGRFENYAADSKIVLDQLGKSIKFPTQSDIGFASMGTMNELDTLYTPEIRALVAKAFESDFELLNYSSTDMQS